MPLEVKKSERENSQSLVRRFSRGIRRSGLLLKARESRFKARKKSRQLGKRTALRREEMRKKYAQLEKMGKLE